MNQKLNTDLEFLCDLANKIRKEHQETHLFNKTYYRHHKVLISAKKAMICCLITIFLRKKLYKTSHWMDQALFYF